MIVCLCEAVSDRKVRDVIAGGCRTVPDIRRACGAGGSCGSCCAMLRDMLERNTAQQKVDAPGR